MLKSASKLGLRQSLSLRLLFYVILCSTIFTLIASSIQLYVTYKKEMDGIQDIFWTIERSHLPSISASAYQMDRAQLEIELKGALAFKDIIYMKVVEVIEGVDVLKVEAGDPNLPREIVRKYPLSCYMKLSCGTLTVVARKEGVYQRTLESALVILITNALKMTTSSICIFFILQYVVTRHLSALALYSKRLSMDQLNSEFQLNRSGDIKDELEDVANAINQARTGLKRDFDEIQRLKYRLMQEKNKIFTTLSCLSEGVVATDTQGRVQFVNSVAENLLGWSEQESIGQPVESIYHVSNEQDGTSLENPVSVVLKTDLKKGVTDHTILNNRYGKVIPIEDSAAPIRDKEGESFGVVLTFRDISEKKKARHSLQEQKHELFKNQNILKEIQKAARIGSWEWNPVSDFLILSDEMCTLLEIEKDALTHNFDTLVKVVHPEDQKKLKEIESISGETDALFHSEVRAVSPVDGRIKYFSTTARWTFDDNKKPLKLNGLSQDITHQKELENRLQAIIKAIPDIVFIMSEEGQYMDIFTSRQELLISEAENLKGKYMEDIFPKKEGDIILNNFKMALDTGENQVFEYPVNLKGGKVWFEARCAPIHITIKGKRLLAFIVKDITDQKEMENRLRQAQKMEAIGTLAGGIAHDFNNILTPIAGYVEIVREELPKESEASELLQEVLNAALRAKELTQQILTFTRQMPKSRQPLKLQPIVKEALKLLSSAIPSTIQIQTDIEGNVPSVLADPTQIHQIVVNLCTNSYHAMRENGGTLKVSLRCIRVESIRNLANGETLMPGLYAQLRVVDNGTGIPVELQGRIFDPYFTTKKQNEGTGMGLAIVHGIVSGCDGTIQVISQPNVETCFEVLLPCLGEQLPKENKAPKDVSVEIPHGSERILVVDDERMVTNLIRQILSKLGYQITVKNKSQEALSEFAANPDSYDLLITDMTMPEMTGDILTKKVLEISPGFPVIICTGYSEKLAFKKHCDIGAKAYMMKPISRKELAPLVRKTLDDIS